MNINMYLNLKISTLSFFFLSFFLLKVCLSENVNYIVSPYKSDAQIAFLLANGYADFAITEDSDLLAYGCKKVCKFDVCFIFPSI